MADCCKRGNLKPTENSASKHDLGLEEFAGRGGWRTRGVFPGLWEQVGGGARAAEAEERVACDGLGPTLCRSPKAAGALRIASLEIRSQRGAPRILSWRSALRISAPALTQNPGRTFVFLELRIFLDGGSSFSRAGPHLCIVVLICALPSLRGAARAPMPCARWPGGSGLRPEPRERATCGRSTSPRSSSPGCCGTTT